MKSVIITLHHNEMMPVKGVVRVKDMQRDGNIHGAAIMRARRCGVRTRITWAEAT